ncbi:hypothetical protein M8C21_003854 [Ambrosia artemisiifolia]|uniref:F-box/kelch-repeat protein n=1 Tax=Ambrosia artemisiifolia TaxID=4212 RepID=A0AAD5BQB1_AMBAR|nr:hypothetical protein M8C21_003854 [Ambrosia artemisiifolia]
MVLEDEEDNHHQQPNEIEASQSVPTLLTELIVEILSRLPVDSLLRSTETYGEVLQPIYDEGNDYGDLSLGSFRERLCVLSNYHGVRADLWIMKEYGVEDSWTKLVSIPYLTDLRADRFSVPLCISNDGKVLLEIGRKLIVYDSKNNSFSQIQKFGKCVQVSTFVESLVSPMPTTGIR